MKNMHTFFKLLISPISTIKKLLNPLGGNQKDCIQHIINNAILNSPIDSNALNYPERLGLAEDGLKNATNRSQNTTLEFPDNIGFTKQYIDVVIHNAETDFYAKGGDNFDVNNILGKKCTDRMVDITQKAFEFCKDNKQLFSMPEATVGLQKILTKHFQDVVKNPKFDPEFKTLNKDLNNVKNQLQWISDINTSPVDKTKHKIEFNNVNRSNTSSSMFSSNKNTAKVERTSFNDKPVAVRSQ